MATNVNVGLSFKFGGAATATIMPTMCFTSCFFTLPKYLKCGTNYVHMLSFFSLRSTDECYFSKAGMQLPWSSFVQNANTRAQHTIVPSHQGLHFVTIAWESVRRAGSQAGYVFIHWNSQEDFMYLSSFLTSFLLSFPFLLYLLFPPSSSPSSFLLRPKIQTGCLLTCLLCLGTSKLASSSYFLLAEFSSLLAEDGSFCF